MRRKSAPGGLETRAKISAPRVPAWAYIAVTLKWQAEDTRRKRSIASAEARIVVRTSVSSHDGSQDITFSDAFLRQSRRECVLNLTTYNLARQSGRPFFIYYKIQQLKMLGNAWVSLPPTSNRILAECWVYLKTTRLGWIRNWVLTLFAPTSRA